MDGTVRSKMASPARFSGNVTGTSQRPTRRLAAAPALTVAVVASLLAGCSSDVTRFDYPAFGLTESNPRSRPPAQPGMRPMQQDEYAQQNADGNDPQPNAYGKQSNAYGTSGPKYRPYSGPASSSGGAQAGTACGANPCEASVDQVSPKRRTTGVLGYADAPQPPRARSASLNRPLTPLPPGAPRLDDASSGQTLGGQALGRLPAYPDDDVMEEPETAEQSSAQVDLPPPLPAPEPEQQAGLTPKLSPNTPSAYVAPDRPKAVAKSGTTILVGEGDSLFRIAQDYGVSVSALMTANKLATPAVRPGQKLFIPGNRGAKSLRDRKPRPVTATPETAAVKPAALPAAKTLPAESASTYTIRAGESFGMVARKLGVKPADLAAANGITDPTRIKQGQVLRVPGTAVAANAPATPGGLTDMEPADAAPAKQSSAAVAAPELDDAAPAMPAAKDKKPAKVAAVAPAKPVANDVTPDDAIQMTEGTGKFRWPVRGRVIGKFNQKGSVINEGIDLAVPLGTEVHAAEDGTVAYAGDELANYGKIVLVRHSGGWVTAYAHNDQLMVKRGEAVRRGQVIAKAGKTGKVDQPMVHFELRKGDQPVDPLPHLAAN
jgi:murein DD-endopeptidase MepM/ murein hydrolase activator NlpD